jgi:uncharacterized protein (TIGR00725 family)
MSASRRTILAVLGSGTEEHRELAPPLGRWIAERGFDLLTGGGAGVMRSVSEGFRSITPRRGVCIGIIPGELVAGTYQTKPGYPNEFVELPIYTHLPLSGPRGTEPMSRNHINVLSGDVLIALPGGAGTVSEVTLALRYNKPIILFGPVQAFDAFPSNVRQTAELATVGEFVLSALSARG